MELSLLHPYKTAKLENNSGYYFDTEHGIRYTYWYVAVNHADDSSHLYELIYEFGFGNNLPEGKIPPYDTRVRDTIIKALYDFFSKNQDRVIYYTCENIDGKDRSRSIVFNRWIRPHKNTFEKKDINLAEIGLYSFSVIHKNNQYKKEVYELIKDRREEYINLKF